MSQTPEQKALARQVLDYLRANPEEHDQHVVERNEEGHIVPLNRPDLIGEFGSMGCVGGWIVFFGMTKAERKEVKWRHIGNLAADLIGANRAEFANSVYYEPDKETALTNLERWACVKMEDWVKTGLVKSFPRPHGRSRNGLNGCGTTEGAQNQ